MLSKIHTTIWNMNIYKHKLSIKCVQPIFKLQKHGWTSSVIHLKILLQTAFYLIQLQKTSVSNKVGSENYKLASFFNCVEISHFIFWRVT